MIALRVLFDGLALPTHAFACALSTLRQAWITLNGFLRLRRENNCSQQKTSVGSSHFAAKTLCFPAAIPFCNCKTRNLERHWPEHLFPIGAVQMRNEVVKEAEILAEKRGVPICTSNPSVPSPNEIKTNRRACFGDDVKGPSLTTEAAKS